MTVVTLDEFQVERGRAIDLVSTAKRFTQSHYSLVVACADFADGPVWVADGAASAAHWLAERTDHCANTVREWIRIGRCLRGLRASAEAFEKGDLSYSKVRALTRFATPENEAELLELAAKVPAADIGTALAARSVRNENDDVIEARHQRQRHFTTRTDPDGTICGSFRLAPLAGGKLMAAVNTTMMRSTAKRQADGTWPTVAQQKADALVDLAVAHGGRFVYEVVVHVSGDGCHLDDGTPLTDSAVGRLIPQAFIRGLIHDSERRPVDATNRRRRPTPRQKRLVKARDRVCVDCGRRDLLEYDHNPPHSSTGHTLTTELRLRCAACHTARHKSLGLD
ncbi:MAG: DUF222 domain-containing protein [Acidimicrobiales bacterium]